MSPQGKCHLCDATCLQCSGPEEEACTSCSGTRFFDNGHCSIGCQMGRYPMERRCLLCHHSCQGCVDEGPNNCTSCNRDRFGVARYLFNSECRDVCPERFYHSPTRRCEPCPAECVICTSAVQCFHCSPGYMLRNSQCVPLKCSAGEVADAQNEDCIQCDEGCKNCERKDPSGKDQGTVCMECEDGYYHLGTDCHQSCPDGTYDSKDSMTCVPCEDENCVICEQSQCYWCADKFYTFEGECVNQCREGFFVDLESRECEPCHRTCATCGGPLYNDCDSCETEYTLEDGECVEGKKQPCPDKHFRNNDNECEQCHSTCKTCSAAGNKDCRSCISGKFLTAQQTCVTHCPPGMFANKTSIQCQDCSEGCTMCQDLTLCQRCRSGLYLQDGLCVIVCQRGFPQGGKCQPCPPECASCESASHCLSCEADHFFLDYSCKSNCPGGYYSSDRECRHCPTHCDDCNQDGFCKKCAEYHFLHEEKCVDDCPRGYFANEKQQECVRCHATCSSCDGPGSDDCHECHNRKAVRYNGECLVNCPDIAYYDKKNNECRDCDRSCLTCSGPEPSSCLSCDAKRRQDATGHCVWFFECPQHSYIDQDGKCHECHKVCRLCTGPGQGNCLNCNEPLFLLNSTCVHQCPDGYYPEDENERVCERCHFNCETCTGRHSGECITCKPGFLKQGSSCVENCSENYFGNVETMVCEHCDPSCSQCLDHGNRKCLSCRQDYVYLRQSGQCLPSCPSNYFLDNRSKTCHSCHPTCRTCSDEGATACLSCYEGYRLMGSICESQCLIGFYSTSQSSDSRGDGEDCRPCNPSCLDCRGPSRWNCTACPALQVLADDGRCLSCCGDEKQHNKPISWQCCDCEASQEECVMGVNFVVKNMEGDNGTARLFVTIYVLLSIALGGGLFLLFSARWRATVMAPVTIAGGYMKVSTNGGLASQNTSSFGEYSDRIIECREEEDEEDDDIIFIYRGLLDEDDIELEYDDESYSYK